MSIPRTSARALARSHEALLLDAYGVLVDAEGAIDGAAEFIADLNRQGQPYLILTNDASKTAERSVQNYGAFGLELRAEQIVTSGSLVTRYIQDHGLQGAPTLVMGPEDAHATAEQAGAKVLDMRASDAEVIIICDEAGYDFLPTLDHVLSVALRRVKKGLPLHLVLPNPDLIYPKRAGPEPEFGIAAGSIAGIIEDGLRLRFPAQDPVRFVRLGKPYAAIFEEAQRRTQTRDMAMIGDQLATDMQGARSFGISAGLVTWGLTDAVPDGLPPAQQPTHIITEF